MSEQRVARQRVVDLVEAGVNWTGADSEVYDLASDLLAAYCERDEARKALVWLWTELCGASDNGFIPNPDVPRCVVDAVDVARAPNAKEG
jgi:hypothetical protein